MKNIFEVLETKGNVEAIQDVIFKDCVIPKGTHMEIYCNPDGIYDEDSNNGFSLFLVADKDVNYFDIINNSDLLESCSVKDDEVRIDIIEEDDEFNRLEECEFTPISKYL